MNATLIDIGTLLEFKVYTNGCEPTSIVGEVVGKRRSIFTPDIIQFKLAGIDQWYDIDGDVRLAHV